MPDRFVRRLFVAVLLFQPAVLTGQEPAAETETTSRAVPQLTSDEIGAAYVASPTSLPSPAEWFHAFSKLGKPRWRQHFREPSGGAVADRHKVALALGASMTDAFIAVEARGGQEVRNVLLEVRAFEETLGIAEKMKKRSYRIGDLADREQWAALRIELEHAISEEEALLRGQLDVPLAELVQMGAMVRAINAGCDIAEDIQLGDKTMCIGDSSLIFCLIQKVEALPEAALKVRVVRDLRRCLKHIRDVWQDALPEPAADSVAEVRNATGALLESLRQNE